MRCRVILYTAGAGRGPSAVERVIEDAANVGVSRNVNAPGNFFFTLPWDHDANGDIDPQVSHVQIQRQDQVGLPWATIGWGLVTDFDATPYDVIWKGIDYLGLFADGRTELKTTFTAVPCSSVISAMATSAIAETDSRVGFVVAGTIETTSETMSVLSDYQARLDLLVNAAQVVQQGTTARPIMAISEASPFTFTFYKNKGSRDDAINLEYGGIVENYHLLGGFSELASNIIGIAAKTSGATVLFSDQSGLSSATYGKMVRPINYGMLPDQATLDKMTASDAALASQPYKQLALAIVSGTLSPSAVAIGNSYPVTIKRGFISLDHAYYVLWGWAWRGYGSGFEDMLLSVLPEEIGLSNGTLPVTADPPTSSTGSGSAPTTVTTYKIQSGDTLSALARKWKTSVQAIVEATNAQVGKISGVRQITNASMIRAGALLVRP